MENVVVWFISFQRCDRMALAGVTGSVLSGLQERGSIRASPPFRRH